MYPAMLCLVLLLTSLASSSGREEVKFDFGWRFSKDSEVRCDPSLFPKNLDTKQCNGLEKNTANTIDRCRDSCCYDMYCLVWQFSQVEGCWVGQTTDCSHENTSWVGASRESAKPPPQLVPDYDDKDWNIIDVPHDGLINGTYSQSGVESHAYLPIQTLYYRKHFNLPSEWKGRSIWIEFDGVFRASYVFLNGQFLLYHDSGYTSFAIRIDNVTSIKYGSGADTENVIALQVKSGSSYSGWWYEGGGIYRHTRLLALNHVHFLKDSVYGAYVVEPPIVDNDPEDSHKGQSADATFHPVVEIVNENPETVKIISTFQILDLSDKELGSFVTNPYPIYAGQVLPPYNVTIPKLAQVELWSINRPYFYKLKVQILLASDKSVLDSETHFIGVRQEHWDPNVGFSLNGKRFIWRGFNNHNDFTGVGVAIPDRIQLFRGQMTRAVGGNAWRMSHNPPSPELLDVLDSIGVVVWDENRQFGDNEIWLQDQRDMVKRDRNHPSVISWSFCNEGGCTKGDTEGVAKKFSDLSKTVDPYRPVTANMNGGFGNFSLTKNIDVQGLSHQSGTTYDTFHKQFPYKPLIGSECCSCRTQRGEDFADPTKPVFGSFNGDCNQLQTGYQLNRGYVVGCMVWTLFDYYGEPTPYGWPMVSSSFGSIDLAGFAKPSAYWYRAWWYYRARSNSTYKGFDVPLGVPSLVDPYASPTEENIDTGYMIHIVQGWEYGDGTINRTIQAYTNAETAELSVNGKYIGKASVNWQGWAEWSGILYSRGKIMAQVVDSENKVLASHTVQTAGAAVGVVATVDVPSEKTGTGSSLVLNGQDTGMISAAIVDASGAVIPNAPNNVTFRIVSGPGRIIGVGNGDPSCHEPNQVSWRSAYHGLARAVVQVTQDSASPDLHRKRLIQIDRDGGVVTKIVPPGDECSSS